MPVILFHISTDLVPGGYLGVDIFFVISGFVITNSLTQQNKFGLIDLLNFWEKRVRRLAPASMLVLTVSFGLALIVLSPHEAVDYGRSQIAAAAFFANFHFGRVLDYFSAPADQHPLLHYWSLAVEEQFYLIWPILLLGVTTIFATQNRRRIAAVAIVLLFSLTSMVYLLTAPTDSSVDAFYHPATRAWELGVGAITALILPREKVEVPFAGVIAIVAGLVLVASLLILSKDYLLPGAWSFPLVISTALLIWLGIQNESIVMRILSSRLLVVVGLISYPLYLWHWPIFSFTRIGLGEEPTIIIWVVLTMATFALSYVTWRFIESPIRGWKGAIDRNSRLRVLGYGAVCLIVTVLLGGSLVVTKGMPWRLSALDREIHRQEVSSSPYRQVCDSWQNANRQNSACDLSGNYNPDQGFHAIVIGSSYADHHIPGLEIWAQEQDISVRQVTNSTCSGVPGIDRPDYHQVRMCRRYHAEIKDQILDNPNLRLVILANHFGFNGSYDELVEAGDRYAVAFLDFARWLAERDINLLVFSPVQSGMNLRSSCIKGAVLQENTLCGKAKSPSLSQTEKFYIAAASSLPNVDVRVVSDHMCTSDFCHLVRDGTLLYRDEGHLNAYGSRWLISKLQMPDIVAGR